jgi:hypothetical protein
MLNFAQSTYFARVDFSRITKSSVSNLNFLLGDVVVKHRALSLWIVHVVSPVVENNPAVKRSSELEVGYKVHIQPWNVESFEFELSW